MDLMIRYEWEGNVRELKNCVERSVVLSRSDYIRQEDLKFLNIEESAPQTTGEKPTQKELANALSKFFVLKEIKEFIEMSRTEKSE